MFGNDEPGQPALDATALRALCDAVEALHATRRVDTLPLVDAYRALRPAGHHDASHDAPDLRFLGAVWGLAGPALFGASQLIVSSRSPRVHPTAAPFDGGVELHVARSPEAGADALAIALGLTVESAKVRRLLGDGHPPAPAVAARLLGLEQGPLAAAFGGEEQAHRALAALVEAPSSRQLHLPPDPSRPPEAGFPQQLDDDGPVFVVAGATERLHDLLSPYARRLGQRLAALAASGGADAIYEPLPVLFTEEPGALGERLVVEHDDGFVAYGPTVLVRMAQLDPATVDPRVRSEVEAMRKRSATIILCGRHATDLDEVLAALGPQVRAVAILAEGMMAPGAAIAPDIVATPGRDPLVIDNTLRDPGDDESDPFARVALTLPSLGLAPAPSRDASAPVVDALCYPHLHVVAQARLKRRLPRQTRVGCLVFAPGDPGAATDVSRRCLARMAAARAEPPWRRGGAAGRPWG